MSGDNAHADRRREGRTAAEWGSLAVSLAILCAVLALVIHEHATRGQEPPAFEVRFELDKTREASGGYFLPVEVRNSGDVTAEDARLEVTLTPAQGPPETADAELRFLAGGEAQRVTVVFQTDPRRGRLVGRIVSFVEPG